MAVRHGDSPGNPDDSGSFITASSVTTMAEDLV
jgi:hypothetical protein